MGKPWADRSTDIAVLQSRGLGPAGPRTLGLLGMGYLVRDTGREALGPGT